MKIEFKKPLECKGGKTMNDLYKQEIIDPGDRASELAKEICFQSHDNCQAVHVVSHQPNNFRGPIGFIWKNHVLGQMLNYRIDPETKRIASWTMAEEVENDGAGGKPQFFTLVGTPGVLRGLGWEIIAMTADDFARSGRFPAVIDNEINVKRITNENLPLFQAMMEGYGNALSQTGLVNITGEVAIMKHSITAFCDINSDEQLILTWGASCIGLAHRNLLIDGSKIKPRMPIVGFWEPGYRCNGGTFLTNLLLEKFGPDIKNIMNNPEAIEFVRKLTIPSRSYAKSICRIVGWQPDGSVGEPLAKINGISHITGGGIWGKFKEILPQGVGAELSTMPEPAEVLLQAQELSWDTILRLTDYQAHGTLHGGCGMLIIVERPEDVDHLNIEAGKDGIRSQVVGHTTESPKQEIVIHSEFKEGKVLSSERPE